jgi:hypothetical protein
MTTRALLAPLLIILLGQAIAANAVDWYLTTVHGTCKFVDGNDRISRRPLNNNTIIAAYIATQQNPPLAKHLKLAYDVHGDRISIVDTNGESLFDVFSFGSETAAKNSTDTLAERQVFLFEGDASEASGSAVLSERLTRDLENFIVGYKATGSFQFGKAATAQTVAEICSGTFSISSKKLKITTPEPAPEP